MRTISTARTEHLCTFKLGDFLFGIEVAWVQEVLLKQPTTRLPLANNVVSGLINLRGQIVTAIDLRCRLGIPPLEDGRDAMNVVVRTNDTSFSLVVDEIGEEMRSEWVVAHVLNNAAAIRVCPSGPQFLRRGQRKSGQEKRLNRVGPDRVDDRFVS